jgi:hypothetical protein
MMPAYCRQQSARDNRKSCDVTVVYTTREGYSALVAKRRKVIGRQQFKNIGLPHDGKLLRAKTPHQMADALRMLQDEGYSVPDGIIEQLAEEWLVPA